MNFSLNFRIFFFSLSPTMLKAIERFRKLANIHKFGEAKRAEKLAEGKVLAPSKQTLTLMSKWKLF
jgi:hypothetical protein